jgi:hypothetical protein
VNSNHQATSSVPTSRKPYAKPRLICYGHVKDIVQGSGGGTLNDPRTHQSTRVCWIAEALYGVDASRTLVLRAWLSRAYEQKRRGWLLISLYARFGRTVADRIRSGHIPARLFLPLFDYLFVKANDHTARMLKASRRRS